MSVREVTASQSLVGSAPFSDTYRQLLNSLAPAGGHGRDSSNWVWGWPGRVIPRGPLSLAVLSALGGRSDTVGAVPPLEDVDPLSNDDFQLALYLCYQLDFSRASSPDWPWDQELLNYRSALEDAFVARLRGDVGTVKSKRTNDVVAGLHELITTASGPSVPKYLCEKGSLDQLREYLVHRCVNELREVDPYVYESSSFAGSHPPVSTASADGGSRSSDVTPRARTCFADTMAALNLDSTPGAYVVRLPASTLATTNLGTMFAQHPQWRAALAGLVAVLEMTSVASKEQFSLTLARFGIGAEGRRFFETSLDVAAHEALIEHLIRTEPCLRSDVLFGAACALRLEKRFSRHVLGSWAKHRSSMLAR